MNVFLLPICLVAKEQGRTWGRHAHVNGSGLINKQNFI